MVPDLQARVEKLKKDYEEHYAAQNQAAAAAAAAEAEDEPMSEEECNGDTNGNSVRPVRFVFSLNILKPSPATNNSHCVLDPEYFRCGDGEAINALLYLVLVKISL